MVTKRTKVKNIAINEFFDTPWDDYDNPKVVKEVKRRISTASVFSNGLLVFAFIWLGLTNTIPLILSLGLSLICAFYTVLYYFNLGTLKKGARNSKDKRIVDHMLTLSNVSIGIFFWLIIGLFVFAITLII